MFVKTICDIDWLEKFRISCGRTAGPRSVARTPLKEEVMSAATAAKAVCLSRDMELPHVWSSIGQFLDHSQSWTIERAAAKGLPHLVQVLASSADEHSTLVMDFAAANGHLGILQWLDNTPAPLNGCSTRAMDDAAKNGHTHVLQWLQQHRSEGCTSRAMDLAAMNGHVDVMQWLLNNRNEGCSSRAADLAAQHGHLHVLEWMEKNVPDILGSCTRALARAASTGCLDVLKWLCDRQICQDDMQIQKAMQHAARGGYLEMLGYLATRYPAKFELAGSKMLEGAIANNHLAVLEFLVGHLHVETLKCDAGDHAWMDVAANAGHVRILEWLQAHAHMFLLDNPQGSICTPQAYVNAASRGFTHVLAFLHDNNISTLDSEHAIRATSVAASKGHLDAIKWLRERQQDQLHADGDTNVIDEAASSGDMETLDYLVDLCPSYGWSISSKGVMGAAIKGHCDALARLHASFQNTLQWNAWLADAFEVAVSCNHVDVVQWLLSLDNAALYLRLPEALVDAAALDYAACLECLCSTLPSRISHDMLTQALESAEENHADAALLYLRSIL